MVFYRHTYDFSTFRMLLTVFMTAARSAFDARLLMASILEREIG
jgi:hypothetical protein